jgi:hypothetical protein
VHDKIRDLIAVFLVCGVVFPYDGGGCYCNMSEFSPGVNSASNRNEYQEYILGVKAAGAQGRQPCHLHVPIVLKSVSLNLLEPSGPVEACNGIALPFYPLYVRYG